MEVESRNQKLKEMEAKYKSLILAENKLKYAIMVKLDRIKELKKYLNSLKKVEASLSQKVEARINGQK